MMKAAILFLALIALVLGKEKHGQQEHAHGARAGREDRIFGGSNAARGEFPYQVSLQTQQSGNWVHFCGGSIISNTAVLTAAHCVINAPIRIRAGILNLDDNSTVGQTIAVSSSVVHPRYVNTGQPTPNDIAILRLSSPLSYTNTIRAIFLPAPIRLTIGFAIVTGWGSTSTATSPNTLQKLRAPLITLGACALALIATDGTSGALDLTNVCTGRLLPGYSVCSGDSGGPLVQGNELIGVVSWGRNRCGSFLGPSVYVRVSSFTGWIQQNMV